MKKQSFVTLAFVLTGLGALHAAKSFVAPAFAPALLNVGQDVA